MFFFSPAFWAFLLDRAFGDPVYAWHPVRLFGRWISFLEVRMPRSKAAGLFLLVAVLTPAVLLPLALQRLLGPWAWMGDSLLIYCCLAGRDMERHVEKVLRDLEASDLPSARKSLAMIVGRETENLGEEDICRACIESTAESFNDGFFAPLCFAFLGASPAAMGFKAVSTMDSMLGYKTERFLNLGWAAAKTDDLLNFIPARLSCVVLALLSFRGAEVLRVSWRDAPKQPSPNSGWPEAAFAAALGVRLGGPSSYGGQIVEKAYLGAEGRALNRAVVREALSLFRRGTWLSLLLGELLWHWIRA